MLRISRLILAALSLLVAASILFWVKSDPVPHDASARVAAADFWKALDRPDAARRPSDIVVYPPRLGVQLVTCVGHPEGAKAAWKYLYVSTPEGTPTVEARLKAQGVAFRTPWQEAALVRNGPWAGFTLAAALVAWGWVAALVKMLAEAKTKGSAPEPAAPAAAHATSADLQKLRELEEEMERGLTGASASPRAESPAQGAPPPTPVAPAVLNAGPLEKREQPAEQAKDYRGEFYPVSRPKEHGFSLVELVVVIGILAVLIALLLPTLVGARRDANAIACAANLRSIAQGLAIYENENNGCIPASYSYTGQTVVNGVQTFSVQGYTHWSYFLFHTGSAPSNAFLCPELEQGGLPPSNPQPGDLLPGQVYDTPGVVDQQAPRVAYTLNEALSPRNKFAMGFQSSVRCYQFIHASSIPHASGTILATEWARNGARFPVRGPGSGSGFYVYSHRPVHAFVGLDGTLDMYQLSQSVAYRRVTAADLDPDPTAAGTSTTRLDWVGRNHGKVTGYPDQRRTNFLYVDGHVECKKIYDTLQPFEWGETFFTLTPNGDMQRP